MTELFPDLPPIAPDDRRQQGVRRSPTGFNGLPRYYPIVVGAQEIGAGFGFRDGGAWAKTFVGRASIDYHETKRTMFSSSMNMIESPAALGAGFATESTAAVRRMVKVVRQAVATAQADAVLWSAPVRVKELTKDGKAVCVIETVLLKEPRQFRKLQGIVDRALERAGLHEDACRYVLPIAVKPDEWTALEAQHGHKEALRQAMILSDKRIGRALRKARPDIH